MQYNENITTNPERLQWNRSNNNLLAPSVHILIDNLSRCRFVYRGIWKLKVSHSNEEIEEWFHEKQDPLQLRLNKDKVPSFH